jgi:hypothetical protein
MDSWGTRWINPVGHVVLIKSVMSSLPLLQFSSLLDPKGAMKDMAQLIHTFLWKEGKSNAKKFHLVNWSIVSSPKINGGMGIRYLEVVNINMGSKLLWRLIMGRKEWWKSSKKKKNTTWVLEKDTWTLSQKVSLVHRYGNYFQP